MLMLLTKDKILLHGALHHVSEDLVSVLMGIFARLVTIHDVFLKPICRPCSNTTVQAKTFDKKASSIDVYSMDAADRSPLPSGIDRGLFEEEELEEKDDDDGVVVVLVHHANPLPSYRTSLLYRTKMRVRCRETRLSLSPSTIYSHSCRRITSNRHGFDGIVCQQSYSNTTDRTIWFVLADDDDLDRMNIISCRSSRHNDGTADDKDTHSVHCSCRSSECHSVQPVVNTRSDPSSRRCSGFSFLLLDLYRSFSTTLVR